MSLHLLSGINGKTNCSSMSDARYATWKRKLFINKLAPSLKSLPPTDEAFEPNVLRGHYQVCCWKYSHKSRPPSLRPLDHGWIYDEMLRKMVPRLVLDGVKMVPDELVQCMSCTCKSVTACKTKKCCVLRMVWHVLLFVLVRVVRYVIMTGTDVLTIDVIA